MQYPPTMATRPSQRRLLSPPKTVLPRNTRLRFSAGFFCLGTLNNIVSARFHCLCWLNGCTEAHSATRSGARLDDFPVLASACKRRGND
jgi:hypothetical protein